MRRTIASGYFGQTKNGVRLRWRTYGHGTVISSLPVALVPEGLEMRSTLGSFVVPTLLLFLVLGAGGSAAADTSGATPSIDEIFARHEAAVGYSLGDGKDAPNIGHWTTTWNDGQGHPDHAVSVIYQAGAYYRSDSTYLGADQTDGFDGRAFWSGTSNDLISASTGFTRPYLVTRSIVRAEAFDASLKATLQNTTDTAYVVRIRPTDGVPAD